MGTYLGLVGTFPPTVRTHFNTAYYCIFLLFDCHYWPLLGEMAQYYLCNLLCSLLLIGVVQYYYLHKHPLLGKALIWWHSSAPTDEEVREEVEEAAA